MSAIRWIRSHWKIAFLLFVIIATIAAYPAYRVAKSWRANHLAERAEQLMNDPETLIAAWEAARSANAMQPENARIARIVAQIYDRADPASAPPFWARVVALSNAAEDRLAYGESLLKTRAFDELERELAALESVPGTRGRALYLEARLRAVQNDIARAMDVASRSHQHSDAPDAALLFHIQLMVLSDDEATREEGMSALWDLVASAGEGAMAAARSLASAPGLSPADYRRLAAHVAAIKPVDRKDRMLQWELLLRDPDADQDRIVFQAAREYDLDAPEELVAFGRWLNQMRLYTFTLRVISWDQALSRQDLFLIRADAMALLDRWTEIGSMLERPRIPIEDYLRAFFRMRVFLETGEKRRARIEWDRALLAAGRDPHKLEFLAQKVLLLRLSGYYGEALERMTKIPLVRRGAYERLIGHYQMEGNTSALLRIYRDMREHYPEDHFVANDLLYLRFLREEPNESDLEAARKRAIDEPERLAYRMTWMLGLLRSGEAERAAELVRSLPIDWISVRDQWKAIAAAALVSDGAIAQAQALARPVDPDNLLPEERELWLRATDLQREE